MATDARRYLVEYLVPSSLRSHRSQPFTFRTADAEVTLHLTDGGPVDGFRATIVVSEQALLFAERAAHDALAKVLDLVSFEMKTAALVIDHLRTIVEGSGDQRQCVVYHAERQPIPLYMMEPNATEVTRLLNQRQSPEIANALYWMRWSYVARTVPEAFFFTWMAIEQLAAQETVETTCGRCRSPLTCPTDAKHGPHAHKGVTRRTIKALLERHGVAVPEAALKMRNSLIHGGLTYTFEKRLTLNLLAPKLRRAVEDELANRLSASAAIRLAEDIGRGSMTRNTMYPCEYRTAFPSHAFPSDAPTMTDVHEYLEATRRGQTHPKIITFIEGPPRW